MTTGTARGGVRLPSPLRVVSATALVVGAAACGAAGEVDGTTEDGTVDVDVTSAPHARRGTCDARGFVLHELAHETRGPGASTSTFDGTGAGIGAGDLDGDGRPDLVLANLHGDTTVHRNVGGMRFEAAPLLRGRLRHPAVVDVDGDGDLDVTLTTGVGRLVLLRNTGTGPLDADRFVREELDGVAALAFAHAWGDLEGDGDLDVVTGSYNGEVTARQPHRQLLGTDAGVVVHRSTPDGFVAESLTTVAQALAVHVGDVDGDGRADVLVGNDLATPDGLWLGTADGGLAAVERPFRTTSYSTMSVDVADVDDDGDLEVYTTDMRPMDDDASTREAYAPVVAEMAAMPVPDDVQQPRNVLQDRAADGWTDMARDVGVHATGWSWSGVFGDLDADGRQDLHVLNGMVSDALFGDRPGAALVEANQTFEQTPAGFEPADWGLDATTQGRGLVLADLDADGDLDAAVNNLNAPATVAENRLCDAGGAVTIDLRWPDSDNTHAVGAVVTASTAGRTMTRTVSTARGYLSSPTSTLHVGLGAASEVEVAVTWPDGRRSVVGAVGAGEHVTVVRS